MRVVQESDATAPGHWLERRASEVAARSVRVAKGVLGSGASTSARRRRTVTPQSPPFERCKTHLLLLLQVRPQARELLGHVLQLRVEGGAPGSGATAGNSMCVCVDGTRVLLHFDGALEHAPAAGQLLSRA